MLYYKYAKTQKLRP